MCVYTEQIFEDGDIVAIKLITANKTLAKHTKSVTDMTEDEFHSYDGKYILVQKIGNHSSWQSAVVPEIHDWWDPDSTFLAAMGIEKTISKWKGTIEPLIEIAHSANSWGSFDYKVSKEENDRNRQKEETLIDQKLYDTFNNPETDFYMVHWGKNCAFASLYKG